MTGRLGRVALFLFCSGACALVYQVAWFRELRLIFGASTASSAAVLAVFMGGLGAGGAILGKRADRAKNPLQLYAHLELGVAVGAALSPLLVSLADRVYIGVGGSAALGSGATIVRLLLSVIVLAPTTFLMGGTLPAAARAVELGSDTDRRRVGALYGVNTFGAVLGCVVTNFFLLEVLGTQLSLWTAALVNLLVGVLARAISRGATFAEQGAEAAQEDVASLPTTVPRRFAAAAAALAGGGFMLMELTWYRTLAPILGGSSYTFGLILAVALVGIGIGGALYARMKIPATLRAFAFTCALEALFIALPFAFGDRLALVTALLRPICRIGFGASMGVWAVIASIVILPTAIVSGAQFPLIIGLYGSGSRSVGRDVGAAYLANTLGSIAGSLGGGFGLLRLVGATGCYRLVVVVYTAFAVVAFVLGEREIRSRVRTIASFAIVALCPLLFAAAEGPTALWRHSGIGAGRSDVKIEPASVEKVAAFTAQARRDIRWEEDGVESSVALGQSNGFAFIVNGKTDGHAVLDAPTQVMSGLLAALLHGDMRNALVIGLGTGSTAGWLGKVETVENVDVVELEPAIVRVARDCAPVNANVLDNPKVHIQFADAREVLRTTRRTYDIIFSEPSNPYRAGISSLYTAEYYRAANAHMSAAGIFVQWMQAYEIDGWAVATAVATLRRVFPSVEIWQPMGGDLLLVARKAPGPVDIAKLRTLIAKPPFAEGLRVAWRTDSAEGVFAHLVANTKLSDVMIAHGLGPVNTDDQNLLEFAFARAVGSSRGVDGDIAMLARRLGLDVPNVTGTLDPSLIDDERALSTTNITGAPPSGHPPSILERVNAAYHDGDCRGVLREWAALGRPVRSFAEGMIVGECAARAGDGPDVALLDLPTPGSEGAIRKAHWAARHGDNVAAVGLLAEAFTNARTNPWTNQPSMRRAIDFAVEMLARDPRSAPILHRALAEPFAVEVLRDARLVAAARAAYVLPDPTCVTALAPLEPPPWDRHVFEMRIGCYGRNNDPRAALAERDFYPMLEIETPIGASIRAPKPEASP